MSDAAYVLTFEQAVDLLSILPGKRGTSDEEIAAVERRLGVLFPEAFRVLLRIVGGDLNWLFPGGCGSLAGLTEFQLLGREIASTSDCHCFNKHTLAFHQYQGESVLYLSCDGTDDPIVYQFREYEGMEESTRLTLSQFIVYSLNTYLADESA